MRTASGDSSEAKRRNLSEKKPSVAPLASEGSIQERCSRVVLLLLGDLGLVELVLQGLTGLEADGLGGGDLDLLAGGGIHADASLALLDFKGAEAHEGHGLVLLETFDESLENGGDGALGGCLALQLGEFLDLGDETSLVAHFCVLVRELYVVPARQLPTAIAWNISQDYCPCNGLFKGFSARETLGKGAAGWSGRASFAKSRVCGCLAASRDMRSSEAPKKRNSSLDGRSRRIRADKCRRPASRRGGCR